MQVTSQWIDGLCFVGTTENGHSVVMEGAAAEGGVKRGPSPMEMLLLGVAGCSSIDVVMIAEKQPRHGYGQTRRRSPARVYRNPYSFQSVRHGFERKRDCPGSSAVGGKILFRFDYAGQGRRRQPQF